MIKTPGDVLGSLDEFESGPGTFSKNGYVVATRVGIQSVEVSEASGKVFFFIEIVCSDAD